MLRRRRTTAPPEPDAAAPASGVEAAADAPVPAVADAPAGAPVRWTEHGPEVVVAPAAVAPAALAMPSLPDEVVTPPGGGVPAIVGDPPADATTPPVSLAMPEVPTDVPPGVPQARRVTPSSEPSGGEPPDGEGPDPAGPIDPADRDALKARLAARGLVRTERSVRIRDIAGPRPEAHAPVTPQKGDPFEPTAAPETAVSDDAEALEPEPFGPTTLTRCPSCRTTQQVAVDATGYRCRNCDKVWRWGVCTSCTHLGLTIARQESWRCGDCGAYSRSWWRTATAPREAQEVVRRKRADAAQKERQRILAVARRRRWKLIAGGVVVVLLAGISALVFTSTDSSSPAEQTRVTCATWTRLKSDIANGALSAAELDAAVADLAADAELAEPPVQLATDRLASSGRPGTADFLIASTELSDACAAAR